MVSTERELATLTDNFTNPNIGIKCWTRQEKEEARELLNKYYEIVEVSDGRRTPNEAMCWIIACKNLRPRERAWANPDSSPEIVVESILNEDDDFDFSDFNDFDDSMDDMDLSNEEDLNLNTLDDTSEVDKANQITVLKKRAYDLGSKWKEIFKQLSELAKDLDLTVSHDEDLNISLSKADGEVPAIQGDLNKIKQQTKKELEPAEETDDNFGPSDYDDRAQSLEQEYPDEKLKQESFKPLVVNQQGTIDESLMDVNMTDIDDDF